MNESKFGGLGRYGLLMEPDEADTPVLNPDVRAIAHAFIREQGEDMREELDAVGVKARRTILLYGPPGTGKTTLAHHLCERIGLRMLLVSAHDLLESTMGTTERHISAMFQALRRVHREVVLFLDEIDGITPKRMGGSSGGYNQALASQLITLMRMIDRYPGIVIAATNRYEHIDPAFLRRLEMKIPIDVPNSEVRRLIILKYLAPMQMADPAIKELNSLLSGASPALIRQLIEGMKRDVIMARALGQDWGAASVFDRLRLGIQPPDSDEKIPLWDSDGAEKKLAALPWPPRWPGDGA